MKFGQIRVFESYCSWPDSIPKSWKLRLVVNRDIPEGVWRAGDAKGAPY